MNDGKPVKMKDAKTVVDYGEYRVDVRDVEWCWEVHITHEPTGLVSMGRDQRLARAIGDSMASMAHLQESQQSGTVLLESGEVECPECGCKAVRDGTPCPNCEERICSG